VKKQVIKSYSIGIGITALGVLILFIDSYFHGGPAVPGTFVDICLMLLANLILWPAWVITILLMLDPGGTGSAVLLVPTAFVWGTITLCFREANWPVKASPELPKSSP
jgi:hypothetical protein